MNEVRFDRMVPQAVLARRRARDLAYLPVGALEWHGSHLPFGTDYFTVTYLAEEAARRFGGVVFPPLHYGDVRYRLHDSRPEWRRTYCEQMDLPEAFASAFGYPGEAQTDDGPDAEDPLPFSPDEQATAFAHVIARTLLQIRLYGFGHIVLLPGHGPNVGFCQRAEATYRENVRRRSSFGPPAKTTTFAYMIVAQEFEPLLRNHWIHADKWEGSITMVAAPGTVRPELLPEDPRRVPPAYLGEPYLNETDGYNPEQRDLWDSFDALDPRNASEEYGRQQIEGILVRLGETVEELLTT